MEPVRDLAKKVNVSISTISRYKKRGKRMGFLKVTHNQVVLDAHASLDSILTLYENHPELIGRAFFSNAKIRLWMPDSFVVKNIIHTRRKAVYA
jgi:hypothetical protein